MYVNTLNLLPAVATKAPFRRVLFYLHHEKLVNLRYTNYSKNIKMNEKRRNL